MLISIILINGGTWSPVRRRCSEQLRLCCQSHLQRTATMFPGVGSNAESLIFSYTSFAFWNLLNVDVFSWNYNWDGFCPVLKLLDRFSSRRGENALHLPCCLPGAKGELRVEFPSGSSPSPVSNVVKRGLFQYAWVLTLPRLCQVLKSTSSYVSSHPPTPLQRVSQMMAKEKHIQRTYDMSSLISSLLKHFWWYTGMYGMYGM